MSKATAPHPSSDSPWPEPMEAGKLGPSIYGKTIARRSSFSENILSSIDETPDFHDPYSDLSLFLAQKIKQEMRSHGSAKKWSLKIEEDLVKKITPDFQKKFPHYRLGIAALRKVWEKIAYYSKQIQHQKEAITQDGKLNIHFFIKENLKNHTQIRPPYSLPPYLHAHQLAMKMSECIATIDATRPQVDELTKIIWSIQRHLLKDLQPQQFKSPYDEYDKVDKLIVKIQLEITAKKPLISQKELENALKEALRSLHELPSFASLDIMRCNVSALLAEKLYPLSRLHTLYSFQQKTAIHNFIKRHAALCKNIPCTSRLPDLVRRILALYALASQLPKDLDEETFKAAIQAASGAKPPLPQSIYAFIAAEAVLLHGEGDSSLIFQAYEEAKYLPELKGKEIELLEIMIWKHLSETEGLLQKLPYLIGQRMEEEIASILIDNPHQSFSSIVLLTVDFFQKTKELALVKKWPEIERKIHMWTLQGDLICRWIRLDNDSPLLQLLKEQLKECKEPLSHQDFVTQAALKYIGRHPELAIYLPHINTRIWILYKYLWYSCMGKAEDSSFDRFLAWHQKEIPSSTLLQELCQKMLPLVPFETYQNNPE